MKCYKCGTELGEGFATCPVCATPVMPETSPVANKVLTVIKDNLFLAICILLSVACGASVLGGEGFSITSILAMIFLWITYSKGREGIVNVKSMRSVSGVVYAEYVISNVVAIMLAVVGFLFGGLISFVGTSSLYIKAFMDAMSVKLNGIVVDVTEAIALGLGWLVAGLFIFIGAVTLIVNLFSWKKIHGFVKSVYVGVQNGGATPVVNAKIARAWLWIFGILSAIGVLGSFYDLFVLLSNGCSAVAYILGAILVDRYFVEKEIAEIPVEINE